MSKPMTVEEMARIIEAYKAAGRRLAEEFRQLADRVLRALRLQPRSDRARHIARFGPRNVTAEGLWLTDLCAAWVHGHCPSPAHCDCRCHE